MKGLPFVLAFTAMTFLAWGAYGPLLHHGTASMGRDSLRAFVGVGIAYFFIAVLVPIAILRSQGEAGKWTLSGTFYSLVAGSVGALGALGVILALSYGGMPVYVMPLVFGFAPIVNTLVTAWMSKTFDQISPVFIGGIVAASLGVGGVLAFKPTAPAHTSTHDSKSEEQPKSKATEKKDGHASLPSKLSTLRYVRTAWLQQTSDPLPPVVVQPAAPTESAPQQAAPQPAAPQPVAPQPATPQPAAPQQPAPASSDSQELPPVVVQPAAPESTEAPKQEPPKQEPTKEPQAPAVETPVELPPVVVQPAPPAEPSVTVPAVTPPTQEPTKPEALKPAETKPAETKPAEAKPAETKPAEAKPAEPKPTETKPETPSTPEPMPKTTPPTKAPEEAAQPEAVAATPITPSEPKAEVKKPESDVVAEKKAAASTAKEKSGEAKPATTPANVPMIILSIVVAAVCWGAYGPMLHQGQARMGGSRLRPFTCVGIAYFLIAIAAPLAVISARASDTGTWSAGGLTWSIIAGAAGAIGALGVILAFNAGGKPYYVMPWCLASHPSSTPASRLPRMAHGG